MEPVVNICIQKYSSENRNLLLLLTLAYKCFFKSYGSIGFTRERC